MKNIGIRTITTVILYNISLPNYLIHRKCLLLNSPTIFPILFIYPNFLSKSYPINLKPVICISDRGSTFYSLNHNPHSSLHYDIRPLTEMFTRIQQYLLFSLQILSPITFCNHLMCVSTIGNQTNIKIFNKERKHIVDKMRYGLLL